MNEMWIGKRHIIPGHMSIKDWSIYLKHKFDCWWYRHIGKYKLVDTTLGRFIPYTLDIFVLSEEQTKRIKTLGCKEYRFIPTGIGNIVKIVDTKDNIIDITDYNTW